MTRAQHVADAMGLRFEVEASCYPASLKFTKNSARAILLFGELHCHLALVAAVFVEVPARRKGAGTALMHAITTLSDRMPLTLGLSASPTIADPTDPLERDTAITTRKLAAWYRRFGFVGPANKLIRQPRWTKPLESELENTPTCPR